MCHRASQPEGLLAPVTGVATVAGVPLRVANCQLQKQTAKNATSSTGAGSTYYVSGTGLASSSTGRNLRAEGPKFWKLRKGLRRADRNFGPETGAFRPWLANSPAKMHSPAPRGRPGGQLVEIGQGPSTSWSKSSQGACEPWSGRLCNAVSGTRIGSMQSR
jgi:hypothetical protein